MIEMLITKVKIKIKGFVKRIKYLFLNDRLHYFKIRSDYAELLECENKRDFDFTFDKKLSSLHESVTATEFDRHYVYHPAWAIRKIKELDIKKHVDISSILSFCATLSAFMPVSFFDYRPANLVLGGLETGSQDLTRLSFPADSIESLSCMHTIEHIGLGRYGDPVDYNGDLKAVDELCRVLKTGGYLFVVVPVGRRNRIVFNAHRIYEATGFISEFSNRGLALLEFTIIPDRPEDGHLVVNPSVELLQRQEYACGCFLFTK